MPIMQIYYPQGSLTGERKAALAQQLTGVLLLMEGNAKTAGGLGFASILFTEVAQSDWWVGGRTDATYLTPPGKFLVRVTIPEGYMNQAHKTEVHVAVTAAILAVSGNPNDAGQGGSVQVIIDEVTEGNWASHGKTISLASIADTVGLPKDGERFQWVQAYFNAKARERAAAGYPADAGGLLGDSK